MCKDEHKLSTGALDAAIKISKSDFANKNRKAAMDGLILSKRVDVTKRLADNLRKAKIQRRKLSQLGFSTKFIDAAIKGYREEFQQSLSIQLNLRSMYQASCALKRKDQFVLNQLLEAQDVILKMDH